MFRNRGYNKHDQYRNPEEIWLSLLAYGSVIGENVRRAEYEKLITKAAHAFCWLCTFITKLNNTDDLLFRCEHNFCDIVYFKFPNKCGHCIRDLCECDPFKMDRKPDKAAEYRALYNLWKPFPEKVFQLSDWLQLFTDIYGGRIYLQTMENICFHFLEEAGEEAQAVRELLQMKGILKMGFQNINPVFLKRICTIEGLIEEYEKCLGAINGKENIDITSVEENQLKARIVKSKMDLVIEFADTFSWFCAILIRLKLLSKSLNINIEKYDIEIALEKEYGKKGTTLICPACSQSDCKCKFFPKGKNTDDK